MRTNNELSMTTRVSNTEIINEYFQWLCDIIHVNTTDKSYWLLAKALHKKEFYGTVPNDDNRGEDGKQLRDKFADENHSYMYRSYIALDSPCTMFEMLIALAERFEGMMADPIEGDRTSRWFWEILGNIELDKYTDEVYYDLYEGGRIDDILNTVLERTYKRNGKGGLFPLNDGKKDQRKVEIWYQMCAYLLENYYI